MDDHPGYRSEVEEQGFHFIHCKRQPQDECHRVQREDIRLVGPDGTVSENQNVEHLVDGTPVVAKYPGRLYDKDEFYPAVVVRSKFNVSLVFFLFFFISFFYFVLRVFLVPSFCISSSLCRFVCRPAFLMCSFYSQQCNWWSCTRASSWSV